MTKYLPFFSLIVSNGWTHLLLLDIKHLVSRRFVWCPGHLSLKSSKSPRRPNWTTIKQSQMSWPKSKMYYCWPNSDSKGVWLEIVSNSHSFLRDTFLVKLGWDYNAWEPEKNLYEKTLLLGTTKVKIYPLWNFCF